jgi:hypothetical protein
MGVPQGRNAHFKESVYELHKRESHGFSPSVSHRLYLAYPVNPTPTTCRVRPVAGIKLGAPPAIPSKERNVLNG